MREASTPWSNAEWATKTSDVFNWTRSNPKPIVSSRRSCAYEDGRLKFPLMVVDFSKIEKLKDVGRITTLDAPHRIADAIFRDSLLRGTAFRETAEGKRFEEATVRRATALFDLCPTALIFGTWDSTGSKGGLGNKFARTLVSEIVAFDATVGVRTSSRIDPLGIEKCELYEDKAGHWTVDPDKAKKDEKGVPIKFGKSKENKGKPSEINHGNVTPDIARTRNRRSRLAGA